MTEVKDIGSAARAAKRARLRERSARVEIGADGQATLHKREKAPARARAPEKKKEAPPAPKALVIGDAMEDETVYAGNKLFVMTEDAKGPGGLFKKKFNAVALSYDQLIPCTERLNAENYLGHNDWRLPTLEELDILYRHRDEGALAGTFESAVYWSSAPAASGIFNHVVKNFSDGQDGFSCRESKFHLRLVRGAP
jgi:hypothetical protein